MKAERAARRPRWNALMTLVVALARTHLPFKRFALATIIGLVLAANFAFLAGYASWVVAHGGGPFDYPIYAEATTRLTDGTLYAWDQHGYIYPYSPVFAWLFIPFAWLGLWIWQALHFVLLTLIPSWPLRFLVLLSAPFWMDAWEGNVGTLFIVAGYWAVRGNRPGTWSFMALSVMIPKPPVIPVLVWLLWRRPTERVTFIAILAIHALAALATGYAVDWLLVLPGASHDMSTDFNFMPSRLIGWWWLPISVAISALLIVKDHPGWASSTAALYGLGLHFMLAPLAEPEYQLRRMAAIVIPSLARCGGPLSGGPPPIQSEVGPSSSGRRLRE